MSGNMKSWTNAQVVNWFEQKRSVLGDDVTNQMIKRLKEYETTGNDLHECKSKDALKDAFEFLKGLKVNTVFQMINKRRLQYPMPSMPSKAPIDENKKFVLNMYAKTKRLKLVQMVSAQTRIIEVTQMFYEQEQGKLSDSEVLTKLKEVRLISGGIPLDANGKLGDYGITNENNLVTVLFSSFGGTTLPDRKNLSEFRERKLNFKKFPFLKKADQLDCITMEFEEETALMPCGHGIAPPTMYKYIKYIFHKHDNDKVLNIRCPVPKCAAKWDWKLVTSVADMNSDEYMQFTSIRDRRLAAMRDERDCPHCSATCRREDGVVIFRMRCSQCSNCDWCWECGMPWNHSGLLICGNPHCKVINNLNNALAKCKTIRQAVAAEEHEALDSCSKFLGPCPSIRACPNCFTLMNHKHKCKHMKCVNCLKYFCWYCLAVKNEDGGYGSRCYGAYTACENGKHARQNFR